MLLDVQVEVLSNQSTYESKGERSLGGRCKTMGLEELTKGVSAERKDKTLRC